MWVQLGIEQHQRSNRLIEEQQHQTRILLHTVQQQQEEMERVRKDNARMMQEQERILKSLSDKQNQRVEKPSADREFQEGNEQQSEEQGAGQRERSVSQQSHPNKNFNEAESENETERKPNRKWKVEPHGEFRKIKPPTFDGEKEEVAEAWLINMNK